MGSALDTPDRSTAVFTKRLVRLDGSQVRYLEAGHGEPVVVLARGDDPSSLPLSNMLAEHFHVFVFDISHLAPSASNQLPILSRDLARTLARVAAVAGLKRYAVVSTSADVAIALWQAIDVPQQIDALVLISPALVLSEQSDAGNDLFTESYKRRCFCWSERKTRQFRAKRDARTSSGYPTVITSWCTTLDERSRRNGRMPCSR